MRAARCQSSSGKVWWSKRSGRIASRRRRWWRVQRRTLLTPVSCSEAKVIVCIKLAPERAVGGVGVAIVNCQLLACELQKSKCSSAFEIPGLERVRFRTELHAYARTSSTLQFSAASSFCLTDSILTRQKKEDAHPTCCEPSASPLFDQHSRVRSLDRHTRVVWCK